MAITSPSNAQISGSLITGHILNSAGGEFTALEDVAQLVAPRRPDVALRIMRCFQGRDSLMREEIIRETGLGQKTFEYYLTKLRRFRLVQGFKAKDGYRYYISVDGFHSRIDTLFVDPVRTLRGKGI